MSRLRRASALLLLCWAGCEGSDQPAGEIEGARRPPMRGGAGGRAADAGARSRRRAQSAEADKRILFGDLHVHTTYSIDAFIYALPHLRRRGRAPAGRRLRLRPLLLAARLLLAQRPRRGAHARDVGSSKQSLRECNERAGDRADPDLVAFVGWEWTQVGRTPETHYGHKNVMFPGLAEDELPSAADHRARARRDGSRRASLVPARAPGAALRGPSGVRRTSSGACSSSPISRAARRDATRASCRTTAARTPPPPASCSRSSRSGASTRS